MIPLTTARRALVISLITLTATTVAACGSSTPDPTQEPTATATVQATTSATPTSSPTQVTVAPTAIPSPSRTVVRTTAQPTSSATPTVTPPHTTPAATLTPTPTATIPVATVTTGPTPAAATTIPSNPTAIPVFSPTPEPTPDPRYGLIVNSDDSHAFETFGIVDYIDYTANLSDAPAGTRKILYIPSVNPVPVQQIQQSATAAPGSVWYVLGEPNAHDRPVEDVLIGLHDTYEAIKQADPTALITSPSMLNFSFSCINCSGYQTGGDWIINFRSQYINLYGEEPPIDIWAIDIFPLVWPGGGITVSEAFPTVRDDLVVRQVEDFRSWLDISEHTRDKPIWITEFGLHWGFEGWEHGLPGCGNSPSPTGDYLVDEVKAYLERVYTWFEANADELNIERLFTFSTYRNIYECLSDSGNGMTLLDDPGPDGEMTEVGEFFYDWVRGIRD